MTASYAPQGESRRKASTLATSLSGPMIARAARDAVVKLDPRKLTGNPVIFATWIVALLASTSAINEIVAGRPFGFEIQIALWLWATVLFANLAESVAEGRGKAAADSLRASFESVAAMRGVSLEPQREADFQLVRYAEHLLASARAELELAAKFRALANDAGDFFTRLNDLVTTNQE